MDRNESPSVAGKAGFGVACAVCCGVPMLVVIGVVSLSAALAGSAALGSLALVIGTAFVVIRRRPASIPRMARRSVAAAGAATSAAGLALGVSSTWAPMLTSVGVALLAAAALMALPEPA